MSLPLIHDFIPFSFFHDLKGCDYYVRHSSTNNSTTHANICVFYKIHMFGNNIVFILPLTKHENMLTQWIF